MTPPIWLDAAGRRRQTRACWTCGREVPVTRLRAEHLRNARVGAWSPTPHPFLVRLHDRIHPAACGQRLVAAGADLGAGPVALYLTRTTRLGGQRAMRGLFAARTMGCVGSQQLSAAPSNRVGISNCPIMGAERIPTREPVRPSSRGSLVGSGCRTRPCSIAPVRAIAAKIICRSTA
jgi:hypothetical protein